MVARLVQLAAQERRPRAREGALPVLVAARVHALVATQGQVGLVVAAQLQRVPGHAQPAARAAGGEESLALELDQSRAHLFGSALRRARQGEVGGQALGLRAAQIERACALQPDLAGFALPSAVQHARALDAQGAQRG